VFSGASVSAPRRAVITGSARPWPGVPASVHRSGPGDRPRESGPARAGIRVAAAAVSLVGLAASAISIAPAGAQPRDPPPTAQSVPPPGNAFPIPLPHAASFADDWHACRDGCGRRHKGNDIFAAEGAPEVAVESGVIAKVDNTDDGLGGLSMWLAGDSGSAYYYAHNSANLVVRGQRVARGQVIGRVGHTGNARTTPSHVHFQINRCGELSSDEPCTVDPRPHLLAWPQGMVDGGADTVGWYRPSDAQFRLRSEAGPTLPRVRSGSDPRVEAPAGELPVAGDWNGDGRDTVGVYRRSTATFVLRDETGGTTTVPLGPPGRTGTLPVAGDWNGDGHDATGLYQRATATFLLHHDDGTTTTTTIGPPGRTDTLPVAGDWNGDGRDSPGIYRRPTSAFLLAGARAGAEAGAERQPGGAHRIVFGRPGQIDSLPVAGDWNGRDLVTIDDLGQIYDLRDPGAVAGSLPFLNAAMLQAGATTPARKAAFLATVRNESGFRVDAVEPGRDRYRGRGFIQLTGAYNYRWAGDDLGLDLVRKPEVAAMPLASGAIAAWYWTVARDINRAADRRDMAAVGIAVGYAPTPREDAERCRDFVAALRYFEAGRTPERVNCERTLLSRLLALSTMGTATPGPGRGPEDDGARGQRATLPWPLDAALPASAERAPIPPRPTRPTSPRPPSTRSPATRPPTTTTTTRPPTSPTTTRPPTTSTTSTRPPTTEPTVPPTTATTTPTTRPPTTRPPTPATAPAGPTGVAPTTTTTAPTTTSSVGPTTTTRASSTTAPPTSTTGTSSTSTTSTGTTTTTTTVDPGAGLSEPG
jgi:Peptidase family M23/Chitinase class I